MNAIQVVPARLFKTYPTLVAGLALVATLGLSSKAHAFYEDVCYLANNGGMTNCVVLPPSCSLTEPVSPACRTQALAAFLAQQNQAIPGRSTVHTDVTYILAQALGFSSESAYWIAAYDEAADLGSFVARDALGQPVPGAKSTATIDGVVRNNFVNGGVLFHFHAPRNNGTSVPGNTDGLNPDVHDPNTEVVLAHVRRWAMYVPMAPECTGGLTVKTAAGNYSTGNSCYLKSNGTPGAIMGSIAAVSSLALPFNPPPTTVPQLVATRTAATNTTGLDISSGQFDAYINTVDGYTDPTHAADARLGLYLHTLADRVSHHVCTDASVLTDPDTSGTFYEYMDNPDCVQTLHALRHMYETGVDFSKLSSQDRTTPAALSALYDETQAFAQVRGVLSSQAADPNFRSGLLDRLAAALQVPKAQDRVASLAKVACDYKLKPFPGAPACSN